MERSAGDLSRVKRLFTESKGPWSWARVGLGFCIGLLVVGIIRSQGAGDILLEVVAAAIGVTVVALLWKD